MTLLVIWEGWIKPGEHLCVVKFRLRMRENVVILFLSLKSKLEL